MTHGGDTLMLEGLYVTQANTLRHTSSTSTSRGGLSEPGGLSGVSAYIPLRVSDAEDATFTVVEANGGSGLPNLTHGVFFSRIRSHWVTIVDGTRAGDRSESPRPQLLGSLSTFSARDTRSSPPDLTQPIRNLYLVQRFWPRHPRHRRAEWIIGFLTIDNGNLIVHRGACCGGDYIVAQCLVAPLGSLNIPWLYGSGFRALNNITSGSGPGCNIDGFSSIAVWSRNAWASW
ncbi:hypothetical protein EDB86DRAFT_2826531 [Lactarius hatsudake]|nr:hypothetical protein EDB86DRAFT_2826531 [Lactarius hatsudake]